MPRKKRLCSYQRFEVFSVHINNNTTKDGPPADIIGDIFLIEDGSYTEVNGTEIFARKKGDYDSFQPGIDTELLLTGPCISHGIDPSLIDIYICFALFDYPPDENEETIYMSYSAVDMYKSGRAMDATQWQVVRHWLGHTETDKIQSKTIFGEYGSVTMDYIVFSISTVEASVEIMVLLKEEEEEEEEEDDDHYGVAVDGRITARNSLYEKNEILLFRSHKGKHVKHGELIPLSRCGLVLPFKSTLEIGANLSIANRCATFRVPNHPCTSKRIVSGKQHCKLLIQVTWTNYMDTVSKSRILIFLFSPFLSLMLPLFFIGLDGLLI